MKYFNSNNCDIIMNESDVTEEIVVKIPEEVSMKGQLHNYDIITDGSTISQEIVVKIENEVPMKVQPQNSDIIKDKSAVIQEGVVKIENEVAVKEPPHNCPKCSRTFTNARHLKCHFHRVHPEFRLASCSVTLPEECGICKKSFPSKNMLTHPCNFTAKGPPFKCDDCDRIYSKKCSLLRHCMGAHKMEKIRVCKVCKLSLHPV